MSANDPIADMLTIIRNAGRAKHPTCRVHGSKVKKAILAILKDEGFIGDYQSITEGNLSSFQIQLKYDETRKLVMREIKRISKPGRRVYIAAEKIRPVKSNLGLDIISTSKGIITNKQAKKLGIGGEVLCRIS
jgi:small subunit ribosomal protein S8